MARVRRSDNHRSNAVRLDQRLRVGKDSGARRGRLRAGGIGVEDPREMRVGGLAIEKARMFGTHHARSNDTHAELICSLLWSFPAPDAFDRYAVAFLSRTEGDTNRPAGCVTSSVSSGHPERALLPRLRPTPTDRS